MRARQVLVTGASGYMGHAIAAGLAADPDLAVHRPGGPHSSTGEPLDVTEAAAVEAALGQLEPDVVVHSAALTVKAARGMRTANPEWRPEDIYRALHKVNVEGTRNLVRAARARAKGLFVFVSSAEVYEYNTGTNLVEESPVITDTDNPQRAFAKTKLEAEQIVQEAGGVVLRFNNAYGAALLGGAPMYLIDSAVDAFRRGSPFTLGNPHGSRNYLDLRDVAKAVSWAMADEPPSGVYNIAGPEDLTNREALSRIAEAMRCQQLLKVQPFDPQLRSLAQESQSLKLDAGKARQRGWEPRHPFGAFLEEIQTLPRLE